MLIDPQRMVLHVGVPKTGTTTLQLRLFAEHPEIVFLGKPYDRPGIDEATNTAIAQLVDRIWTRTSFEYDHDEAQSLLARGLQGRVEDNATGPVVLSEEAITQASGADRLLKAKRLRQLFGHCRVLITIREQLAALRSGHRWVYTRRLTDAPLNAWVRRCASYSHPIGRPDDFPLRQYRYGETVDMYRRLFGADRVKVIAIEQLQHQPEAVSAELTDWLGISAAEPGCCDRWWRQESAANTSPGRLGMAYQRFVRKHRQQRFAKLGQRDPLAHAEYRAGVHGAVMRAAGVLDERLPRPALDDRTRHWLENYYREDNRRLADRVDLSLGRWGYSV